jgi:hypothetical protein
MKIGKLLLVWLFAAACANASGSAAQNQQTGGFLPMGSEQPSNVTSPGSIVPKPSKIKRNPLLQASFPNAKADVVDDMRATSTIVQQEAANAATPDQRLMALAALGLIALQLRRKHRSLLQRRISPSS